MGFVQYKWKYANFRWSPYIVDSYLEQDPFGYVQLLLIFITQFVISRLGSETCGFIGFFFFFILMLSFFFFFFPLWMVIVFYWPCKRYIQGLVIWFYLDVLWYAWYLKNLLVFWISEMWFVSSFLFFGECIGFSNEEKWISVCFFYSFYFGVDLR